jgi:hypothetical protein
VSASRGLRGCKIRRSPVPMLCVPYPVPPAGFVPEGNAHDLGFRAVSWLSRKVLNFRDHRGRASPHEGCL